MTNTRLEAALQGIGDGARLEQLAADLLSRTGYEVEPTGTRGRDGGRDSLLFQDDEQGILHCSVAQNWEKKAHEDTEKADTRPENFDFFVFATTQNPAAIKRDRVKKELEDEYGWRVRILDFEQLRNQLMGNVENHYLAREHLSVDPGHAFEDPERNADEFYEACLERLHDREGYYGSIRDEEPILAVHMIPAEFDSDHDRLGSEFSEPPHIPRPGGNTRSGGNSQYGDFVIAGVPNAARNGDEPFWRYACFHEDGWVEAVTTQTSAGSEEEPALSWFNDTITVEFVEKALEWYSEADIHPPFYTYITLLDASEYEMFVPMDISGPYNHREVGTDEFRLGHVTIESYDADVPALLRKPLYRLWNRTGWSTGSPNYTEQEDEETGEITYDWDPRE